MPGWDGAPRTSIVSSLTHFHEDHAGAAAAVAGWGDVEVFAGREDTPFLTGTPPGPLPRLTPAERAIHPGFDRPPSRPVCRVDRLLDADDELDFGGGARVVAVPGHTPGSIALHLSGPDDLLTGATMAGFGHGNPRPP